jgi:hypothetical protein
MVCTDGAVCGTFVAVSDLPGARGIVPGRAFGWVEYGVATIFGNFRGKLSALNPGICRARVEVQLHHLWWCAYADFGNV